MYYTNVQWIPVLYIDVKSQFGGLVIPISIHSLFISGATLWPVSGHQ